jgi:SAM-dependent methyltransferase
MSRRTGAAYRDDLAYIHDAGFGEFARRAGAWLLPEFRRRGVADGLVVDLGCGSGIWAEMLAAAGYDVTGYDISGAMVEMSRQRAPRGDFRRISFLSVDFPPCAAVTALGEVFNYLFDQRNSDAWLFKLFRRVHAALRRGGLFVFDGAEPGRVPGGRRRNYSEGPDWACLFTAEEDSKRGMLTRHITSFRRIGASYRRDREVHRLRLFNRATVLAQLRSAGFRARILRGYGDLRFPAGYVGFLASKP